MDLSNELQFENEQVRLWKSQLLGKVAGDTLVIDLKTHKVFQADAVGSQKGDYMIVELKKPLDPPYPSIPLT